MKTFTALISATVLMGGVDAKAVEKLSRLEKLHQAKDATRHLITMEDYAAMTFDEDSANLRGDRDLKQKDNFLATSVYTDALCANKITEYGLLVGRLV
jgi:hypothetical protein